MVATSSHLNLSLVKDIFTCPDCNKVHVSFWDAPKKVYSGQEWQYILEQGSKALSKIKDLVPLSEDDPKVF